jgi:hypothetical protein
VKRIGIWIGLFVFCGLASAEVRGWEDNKGHRFKAEFVQELFGDIMLKEANGHTRMIKLDDLSSKDQAYLFQHASPTIEINLTKTIRKRPEMEWTIPEDVTTLYTCMVRINKISELPYKGKLTAELFLLATEVDGENYILIQREKSEFVFPEGKRSQHEFQAKDVQLRRYNASWAATASRYRGAEYFGYLIAVSDDQGRIISSKTDIKDADWITGDISTSVEGLRKLAINGRGSVYSRHFDTTFEKTEVPRIPWHKRDAWF